MVDSREKLREYCAADNVAGAPKSLKQRLVSRLTNEPQYVLCKYLTYLRKEEYYINTANGNKLKGMLGILYDRKLNRLGNRLGIEIGPNCFGKGLTIYHIGSIIVNPAARIGENCRLHGSNCIGNNGKSQGVPRIGNNVDIGYGAVVIGDIEIADDVVIGANAVVNKSVLTPGSVVVGVPGYIVKEK
jgi:serine O-acetyltransferase